MNEFDYLDLNGRSLKLFMAVYQEGSVTKAAARLNVSQSAVSHMLDKLRQITGDPLFVRSGRGIAPTSRAHALAELIPQLLFSLENFTRHEDFDPAKSSGTLSIAAAAIQSNILLPQLANILSSQAPALDLKIINSGVNGGELLRTSRCDLLITPSPPKGGTEFLQKKIMSDEWVCFYDRSTTAPITLDQYLARPHAKVIFSDDETSMIDVLLDDMGKSRRVSLRAQSFTALVGLMRDTDLIIALPRLTGSSVMREFASCPLPFNLAPLNFYLVWHLAKNHSPFHQWIRRNLTEIAAGLGR